MIEGLKPYPRIKDSGVPWLGEVPEHWEVLPNRALFEEVNERNHPEAQMLSVTITRGVVPQKAQLEEGAKKDSSNLDKSAYKVVRPGDIVYNKMRAWQGAIGVSDYEGIVSPAYVVQRPRPGTDPKYHHYLLRTPGFAKEAERWSYGITSDMWSLRPEHFRLIYSCRPPMEEQAGIVRFLGQAEWRIRRYLGARQRLVNLLEEQKQAVINYAVTRGHDSNVRLKSSGISVLGDVPEHWEIVRLKDAARVQTGITLGKDYRGASTASYPYLRVANVQAGRLDLTQVKHVDVPDSEASRSTLRDGDVLMTEGGDIDKLGRGCVWQGEIPECLHQNHVFAVRCDARVLLPEFLVALMASQHGRAYFQSTAKQTTNLAATNSTTLREFPLVLPTLAEQQSITEELSEQTVGITKALDGIAREIQLQREHQMRLIADAVTGKVDVREAAARIPEGDVRESPSLESLMIEANDAVIEDVDAELESVEA